MPILQSTDSGAAVAIVAGNSYCRCQDARISGNCFRSPGSICASLQSAHKTLTSSTIASLASADLVVLLLSLKINLDSTAVSTATRYHGEVGPRLWMEVRLSAPSSSSPFPSSSSSASVFSCFPSSSSCFFPSSSSSSPSSSFSSSSSSSCSSSSFSSSSSSSSASASLSSFSSPCTATATMISPDVFLCG